MFHVAAVGVLSYWNLKGKIYLYVDFKKYIINYLESCQFQMTSQPEKTQLPQNLENILQPN